MTGQMTVLLNQMMIFAILMAVGFAAAKAKVITREGLHALSALIVKVILPALIFSIIAGSGVTIHEFFISGRFAAGVLLCYSLLILTAFAMGRFLKLGGTTGNVFVALASFGNMGFMGIPLIQAVFKEPVAQVCISVYTLVDMALLWTLGVYLCSRHQKDASTLKAVRNLVNPTTVALLAAFMILILRIPVPGLLMDTISGIGGTSKYLTLIYLGGSLAFVQIRHIHRKPNIFVLTGVKMLVLPVVAYILLGFFLPQVPRTILTLIVGLPAMTTVAMVAKSYGSDDVYATEVIFVTTLCSLVTIPAVNALTHLL